MIRSVLALAFIFSFPLFAASNYFSKGYEDARADFRRLVEDSKNQFDGAHSGFLYVPSRKDRDLTVDFLYIPAKTSTEGLVVLTSGVHGVEAYAGSAMQRLILEEYLLSGKLPNQNTGYLFIHAINPYGFKYGRRVSENSVDLNRNFGVSAEHFKIKNPYYGELKHILMPERPASSSWLAHFRFLLETAFTLGKHSMATLKQAIAGGQYEHPKGIFYGGRDFEPNQKIVEQLLLKHSAQYTKVLFLDFHTGFGERGFMHLLPNPTKDEQLLEMYRTVFGDYPIETTGDDFYSNEGDFSTYAAARLAKEGKVTIPMLVEYGTLDSQTYQGSIASLSRMVLENQKHWHGARTERDGKRIQDSFMELFFPSAADWRERVVEQSREHLPTFIENFDGLKPEACAGQVSAVSGDSLAAAG